MLETAPCQIAYFQLNSNNVGNIPRLPVLEDKEFFSYVSDVLHNNSTIHSSFKVSIINDVNRILMEKNQLRKPLVKLGLLRRGEMTTKMRNRLSRFMFCPNKKLMREIKQTVASMQNKTIIGFQLRTGGTVANTNEKATFIPEAHLPQIAMKIKKMINPKTAVYVSTDSNLVLTFIQKFTQNRIYFMNTFKRGHSSPLFNKDTAEESTEGAICDLGVLSFSKQLYFTQFSSYGHFAYTLSKATINTLSR